MENFDERLDSHALRVLVEVVREGSFTAAALSLGINQSTVSYTISKLRRVFGDELFIRSGRGVEPTERCRDIVGEAERILRDMARLAAPPDFDPATSEARVVISCNFYERTVLLPHLFRMIRCEAPQLHLSVIQSQAQGHKQLLSGDCDLLLSPLLADPAGLYTRVLFSDRYACFVDRHSKPARSGLSLEDYRQAEHVAVSYAGGWRPFYRDTLKSLNMDIVPRIELPSLGMVHRMIEGTSLVLTAPAALEAAMGESCVRIDAPFDCRFDLHMVWSGRAHRSPLNRWLRACVVQAARAVTQARPAGT